MVWTEITGQQQGKPAVSQTAESPESKTVLRAEGLVMRFGGITATNNVTLNLRQGARHALIGPNGAG